jgi:hypothetical protein
MQNALVAGRGMFDVTLASPGFRYTARPADVALLLADAVRDRLEALAHDQDFTTAQ